jgi:hypothetical protein
VEVELSDGGRAVQRLVGWAGQQDLDDCHALARDDALGMGLDSVGEISAKQGGEMAAAAALDAVGHAEGHVRRERGGEHGRVAGALEDH